MWTVLCEPSGAVGFNCFIQFDFLFFSSSIWISIKISELANSGQTNETEISWKYCRDYIYTEDSTYIDHLVTIHIIRFLY